MADQKQIIEKKGGGDKKEIISQLFEKFKAKEKEEAGDLENQPKLAPEKEGIKEPAMEKILKERIQKSTGSDDNGQEEEEKKEIAVQAEDISKIQDAEVQIEKLVELATAKDPITAIKVAKHLDENYVLDKFHDKLMEDEVRKVLIEKGLLEEN